MLVKLGQIMIKCTVFITTAIDLLLQNTSESYNIVKFRISKAIISDKNCYRDELNEVEQSGCATGDILYFL